MPPEKGFKAPGGRGAAIELLIERVLDWERRGVQTEVVTADQHADGAFLHAYVARRGPARADEVARLLERHGGCSAGCTIASVDPLGFVHACQFWGGVSLGNVRVRRFSEIWRDPDNPTLCDLRGKRDRLKGKCAECAYREVCGGCRVRAEAVYGDAWAEDPACYLAAQERAGCLAASP